MKPGIYYSKLLDQLLICWEVYQSVELPSDDPVAYLITMSINRPCGIAVESGWRPTLLIDDKEFDELQCEYVVEL